MATPKRPTKATKALLINASLTVYGLLSTGLHANRSCNTVRKIGTSQRGQADEYIARAREMLEQDCQLSRQQFLAECTYAPEGL